MSSYKQQNLFGSGPHRFAAHGRSLRLAEHETPGVDGAAVTSLGRSTRRIDQTGSLIADDLAGLQNQLDAVEAAMDGTAGSLIDESGRSFDGVLLVRFAPGEIHRLGPRLAVDYQARYVQVNP